MSNEKKVRELLDQTRVIMGPIRRFDDEVQKALSEPPDVVVLLRWMIKQEKGWRKYQDQAYLKTEEAEAGCIAAAFRRVRRKLEKTVRLTDDGWEWVEDGE